MIGRNRSVGIITANKEALTWDHLHACDITEDMNVYIQGLENCREWSKIFEHPEEPFDMEAVSKEILGAVEEGIAAHPDTGLILLECTDLPPYARQIREKFGLPVLDINSLVGHVAISLGEMKLYD